MADTLTAPAPVSIDARPRSAAAPGWLPAALATATLEIFLYACGTPATDLLRVSAYLLLGVVVPGTLLWRLANGRAGTLAGDVAGGAATGYAIEVLAYIAARAAGAPLLVLVWPVATIGAFLAVPRLRRHWRGSGRRTHVLWNWSVAAVVVFCVVAGAWRFFPAHALRGPASGHPYVDLPYYLALIGEAKNHMPPTYAPVAGEPLHHHWFVIADIAATSWVTGVEPMTLLYRISVVPMIALFVVGVALVATRVGRRWWAGPAALGLAFCTAPLSPFGWTASPVITGGSLDGLWLCPTQTFGSALFPVVMLVVLKVMDGGRRPLLLLVPLLATLIGAKPTFVPMLIVGLCYAFLVRRSWRTAVAAGLAGLALLGGELLVYHGDHMGMRADPLGTARVTVLAKMIGPESGMNGLALVTAIVVGSAALRFCLAAGLGRRLLRDPAIALPAGISAAGVGATFAFSHPSVSQLYFFRSACPVLAILAAAGLARLVRSHRAMWSVAVGLAGGVTIGFLVPYVPLDGLFVPYAVMIMLAIGAGLLARRAVGVAVLAALTGLGVAPFVRQLSLPVASPGRPVIAKGALEAGRWLRDHSDPDDLVATDVHCSDPARRACDAREFAVSAYTERRVLVEGWAYTSRAHAEAVPYVKGTGSVPYADPGRLAANDLAFARPSATAVGTLRDRYGVRWLFLDRRVHATAFELARYATLRYARGDVAVFEIR